VLAPVLNGLKGDLVASDHPELEIPMALRFEGADVSVGDVPRVYADATGHLVVFVHGLAEDERAWSLEEDRQGYPERLATDTGATAVLLRYNSGLRISDNGERLAALLDSVVRHWPVPVRSISLVGHSMGGLVIRSACAQGSAAGMAWVAQTATVITLGTPHTGAPLEKVVNVVDWVMRRVPEAEPIGRVLAERATGVKDLRFGSLVAEDWQGRDPDELLRNTRVEVPLLPHVNYHWVAGSITDNTAHPVARLVGDGMVRVPSASAVGDSGVHVGGTGHMKLLASDEVYAQLLGWVSRVRE
jgi:pimeloyl-ACP methyl ester carboxylesterase